MFIFLCHSRKQSTSGILPERCRTSRNDRNLELWQRPQGVIIIKAIISLLSKEFKSKATLLMFPSFPQFLSGNPVFSLVSLDSCFRRNDRLRDFTNELISKSRSGGTGRRARFRV